MIIKELTLQLIEFRLSTQKKQIEESLKFWKHTKREKLQWLI